MKKKILFIGAGQDQVPMLETAKKMGCIITVVSPHGDYPGLLLADEILNENVLNKEAIVEYAKDKKFDAVLSGQSDLTTPIVAYVAEKLGLPTFGVANAYNFTDKGRMREIFKDLDIPCVENFTVETYEDAEKKACEIGYPIVIKPVDSSGSKGISAVRNSNELKNKFEYALSVSKSKEVIVEKFIEGTQHISLGYVDQYKLTMFACLDREYMKIKDVFIPSNTIAPSLVDYTAKKLIDKYMYMIVDYLKPRFGNVWAEWIYDVKTKEAYIIEISIREAGACITSHIFPYAYGVDTQKYVVNSALGLENGSFSCNKEINNTVGVFYFLLPEGKIVDISGIEMIDKIEGVIYSKINKMKIGDEVSQPIDKTHRKGYIVIKGKDRIQLQNSIEKVKKIFTVNVQTTSGKKGIIWE